MDPVTLTFMPIFGLLVGSFLNLTIDRIPFGLSIVRPASRCDNCQKRLGLLDLVPIFSYLWLKGKCSYCGARIPLRSVVVELLAGCLFGVAAYQFGFSSITAVLIVYGSLFIALSAIDLEHTILPDKLVFPGIVLALFVAAVGPVGEDRGLGEAYLRVVAGGATGLGIMLAIYLAAALVYRSTAAFGFGDVKLGALIGLVLGFPDVLVAVYFAFVSGGVIATCLLLLKIRGRQDAIPYGPFLAGGAIATMLAAQDLSWYLDVFQ